MPLLRAKNDEQLGVRQCYYQSFFCHQFWRHDPKETLQKKYHLRKENNNNIKGIIREHFVSFSPTFVKISTKFQILSQKSQNKKLVYILFDRELKPRGPRSLKIVFLG